MPYSSRSKRRRQLRWFAVLYILSALIFAAIIYALRQLIAP